MANTVLGLFSTSLFNFLTLKIMKNFKSFSIALFTIFLFLSVRSFSQGNCTSFTLANTSACPIVVNVTSLCNGSSSTCGGLSNHTILANSSYVITGCSSCGSCDYTLTLLKIDGVSVGPTFPTVSTLGPLSGTYSSAICPSNGNITVATTGITVD